MKYTLDIPYPSTHKLENDIHYGEMILSDLGGTYSKMNTISLYFYNHIILEKQWPKLSNAMEKVCVVKILHLKFLSKMCFQLGVDPRLWECQNDSLNYWSPNFNVYPQKIDIMLENAILQEKKTINHYQQQISQIDNQIITDMLQRIILDDELHIKIFETFLQQYSTK